MSDLEVNEHYLAVALSLGLTPRERREGMDKIADAARSLDPCPEWHCPDLSAEDRRDGKTCPDHPCTCSSDPSSGGTDG